MTSSFAGNIPSTSMTDGSPTRELFVYDVRIVGLRDNGGGEIPFSHPKTLTDENRIVCSLVLIRLLKRYPNLFPAKSFCNRSAVLLCSGELPIDGQAIDTIPIEDVSHYEKVNWAQVCISKQRQVDYNALQTMSRYASPERDKWFYGKVFETHFHGGGFESFSTFGNLCFYNPPGVGRTVEDILISPFPLSSAAIGHVDEQLIRSVQFRLKGSRNCALLTDLLPSVEYIIERVHLAPTETLIVICPPLTCSEDLKNQLAQLILKGNVIILPSENFDVKEVLSLLGVINFNVKGTLGCLAEQPRGWFYKRSKVLTTAIYGNGRVIGLSSNFQKDPHHFISGFMLRTKSQSLSSTIDEIFRELIEKANNLRAVKLEGFLIFVDASVDEEFKQSVKEAAEHLPAERKKAVVEIADESEIGTFTLCYHQAFKDVPMSTGTFYKTPATERWKKDAHSMAEESCYASEGNLVALSSPYPLKLAIESCEQGKKFLEDAKTKMIHFLKKEDC